MAKTVVAPKREAGIRVLTLLVDNQLDIDIPEDAEVMCDRLLDNDEPEQSSTGNGYKLAYASFADPNDPHIVAVKVDGKVVNVPVSGQTFVGVSKKAIDKANRKA